MFEFFLVIVLIVIGLIIVGAESLPGDEEDL